MELGAENIRVNCLAPGMIKTKFSSVVRYYYVNGMHAHCTV